MVKVGVGGKGEEYIGVVVEYGRWMRIFKIWRGFWSILSRLRIICKVVYVDVLYMLLISDGMINVLIVVFRLFMFRLLLLLLMMYIVLLVWERIYWVLFFVYGLMYG